MRWTRISAVLDYDGMVRGDQRSSFSVSMLRVCEHPRLKHSGCLVVLSVELGMPFDLSEPRVASASETLESWLSHRRPSGAALRSMVAVCAGIGNDLGHPSRRYRSDTLQRCSCPPVRLLTKGPHPCSLSFWYAGVSPPYGCRFRCRTSPPAVLGSRRCHRR